MHSITFTISPINVCTSSSENLSKLELQGASLSGESPTHSCLIEHSSSCLSLSAGFSQFLSLLTLCAFLVSTHLRSRLQLHPDDFKMMSLALSSPHKLHIHISPSTGYHQCCTPYESIYPLNFPIWVNHATIYPITQVRALGIVSNSSFSLISASERSLYSFNSTS